MTWTAAKERLIAQMWADGYSGTVIGQRIGKTRNAVIGKLGRMGCVGDPERNRARAVARDGANKKRREARQRVTAPVAAKRPPRTTQAPPEGIPIEALGKHTCRWPVHEQLPARYCGQRSDTGRYCPEHERRAVSPGKGART